MKILFASNHSLVDPTNGASRSMRDILSLVTSSRITCHALSGAYQDVTTDGFRDVIRGCLEARELPYEEIPDQPSGGAILRFDDRGVPTRVYLPRKTPTIDPDQAEGKHLLRLASKLMDSVRPDIFLTYGGLWIGRKLISMAKQRGVPVVFRISNFDYRYKSLFEGVHALVPSEYSAAYYAKTLSLRATAIPSPQDWSRLALDGWAPRYLTFVNPSPIKGGLWAARIVAELTRRRPDIPILIVEGRGSLSWFCNMVARLGDASRVGAMRTTEDPRDFYRVTRMVLMPSMRESCGRVAQECLILRIPIVASNRGGLQETLREAGAVLDIPPRYDEHTTELPSAAEVEPWIAAILALWDDPGAYEAERERCGQAARAFHPDVLAARYRSFFEGVRRR